MKFATNHPDEFTQPTLAFLTGFLQFSGGMLCEFACLFYLSTIESTMDVIIKFIALGKIAMIDDMYAAAIPRENKIKRNTNDLKGKGGNPDVFVWKNYRRLFKSMDPRSCWQKTLSVITKVIRVYYCSMIFYFLPFITLNPFLLGANPTQMVFEPDLSKSICQYLGYVEPYKLGITPV